MKLRGMYIALFVMFLSAELSAAAEGEYTVKAAMLYNFAKFVEWPGDSFGSDSQIIYCIAGKSPINAPMLQMQGKLVKGMTVFVRQIAKPSEVTGCQILFIPQSERARMSAYLQESSHHKILTVSDLEQFAESGGMIRLSEYENKIRFEINQGAAHKQGIRISSHLLSLARRIR